MKPRITIIDNLNNQIYTNEYLTLKRAKDSLLDNSFVILKRMKLEKAPDGIKDDTQPKQKILYKSTNLFRYKAILEY
jgi:hypothetical protein